VGKSREKTETEWRGLYASPLAANQPPNPMEIAPAINSARPPKMTILLLPRADSGCESKRHCEAIREADCSI